MPTGKLFLLFTHAVVVARMILLGGTAVADCLSAPNQTPAEGEHWYYRTNRETNIKCWSLGGRDAAGAGTKLQEKQAGSAVIPQTQSQPLSAREKEELFKAFVRWKKSREMQ